MTLTDEDFKKFPTTRYQGSKRKIIPWIYQNLNDIEFETVLDAFGGSASVSYLFKKMGKTVTYNDKLHFNFIIGKAIIENQSIRLTEEDINQLTSFNDQIVYSDFIEKTFQNIYYKKAENTWLDKVTNNIVQMNHYQPHILDHKKALAYYALFQSSLIKRPFNLFHRKNLKIRTRNVERNFGNKVTWDKPFEAHFLNFAKEVNGLVFNSEKTCKALNKSIFDIDPNGYDLVYFDPPYLRQDGSNESSNYLKCYHFLEGLSRYNEWENQIDYDSRNRQLKNIQTLNDFKQNDIIEVFGEILDKFKDSKIVFSYKVGGSPSIETLTKLMRKIKSRVYTVSKSYSYALNHQNGHARKNREVLIIGV